MDLANEGKADNGVIIGKLDNISGRLGSLEAKVDDLTFFFNMETGDMSGIIPFDMDQGILAFLDREDPEYQMRKNGFLEYLRILATKNKKQFAEFFLREIFTRNYMANHKWQPQG